MKAYKVIEGSPAHRFLTAREPIRMYAGGFANGKTTALVAAALTLVRDYPGSVGLIARATYPKLNDTIRREFFNWCPRAWIKSFNKKDNICEMHNGSIVNFRYIAQRSNTEGEGTSNLLSANYDWAMIDQIDDPELEHKDFLDIIGRLRGASATYAGADPTMPSTGPGWLLLSSNPTRNWVYKELVKPYHDYLAGRHNERLIRDPQTGKPLFSLFEASTLDNLQNLEAGERYLNILRATYHGKMWDRYVLGKWIAFEGVVYDEFDATHHVVAHDMMLSHLKSLSSTGELSFITEGYDFGIAAPSAYFIAAVDVRGCVYVFDGFYRPEARIEDQVKEIKRIRRNYNSWGPVLLDDTDEIYADPALFKRTPGRVTVAQMFADEGLWLAPGNNDKQTGIQLIKHLLLLDAYRINPFTNAFGAPLFYLADTLPEFVEEFETWRWKGDGTDATIDRSDHALDALRYGLSRLRSFSMIKERRVPKLPLSEWHEVAIEPAFHKQHRYG